jgi:hypothetical protein
MDESQLINGLALLIALAAVVTSSLLAWRTLRLTRNANHLPIVLDALAAQRTADFTRKEAELWQELPNKDPDLGFSSLPEPLRGSAFEVSCYYQHLGCLAEYGVADWDFIAVQVTYRMLRTWDCIRPFVQAERTLRGSQNSFLNSYERFASNVKSTDIDAATARLYRRGRRPAGRRWNAAIAWPATRARRTALAAQATPTLAVSRPRSASDRIKV